MATFKKFEDIEAWKKSRELITRIYSLFPKNYLEDSLLKQMKRSAISIGSNIAEGFERNGNKEFIHFLYISKGSCGELRSQLYNALDQKFIDETTFGELNGMTIEISKIIMGLIVYLSQSSYKGYKFK